jgi:hypothetical protein
VSVQFLDCLAPSSFYTLVGRDNKDALRTA